MNFIAAGEAGLVDVLEDIVRALERKHAMERELLIYFLQGRESVQSRSAAKKLSAGMSSRAVEDVYLILYASGTQKNNRKKPEKNKLKRFQNWSETLLSSVYNIDCEHALICSNICGEEREEKCNTSEQL